MTVRSNKSRSQTISTKFISKSTFLTIAEVIDGLRLVPRGILLAYGYLIYHVINWFMLLDTPTTQQASFVSTIVGAAAVIIGLYSSSGRKWVDKSKVS